MKAWSFLLMLLLGLILITAVQTDTPPHTQAKDYFYHHGVAETGAINLVTSIYLGYRVFDTLGETIVLLLSVTGVIFFLEHWHEKN